VTEARPESDPVGAPPAAGLVFGDRLELAERYARQLGTDGVVRGLIGPREVDRLWERHLLNSAVLTELVPFGARVVDVGSGAGLPGLAMAIRRADLHLELVEPMLRRTEFLSEVVAALGLGESVRIIRGRAEEPEVRSSVGNSDWVVARAVAPLDRLVRWCLPLLAPGGHLLALKGARAQDEVTQHEALLHRLGAGEVTARPLGEETLSEPTWVVSVERSARSRAARTTRPARRGKA
jgi:16S rRNA (guanine527-N7)-methyltransferase